MIRKSHSAERGSHNWRHSQWANYAATHQGCCNQVRRLLMLAIMRLSHFAPHWGQWKRTLTGMSSFDRCGSGSVLIVLNVQIFRFLKPAGLKSDRNQVEIRTLSVHVSGFPGTTLPFWYITIFKTWIWDDIIVHTPSTRYRWIILSLFIFAEWSVRKDASHEWGNISQQQ